MIRQETVNEFSERVTVEQCGTNHAQFVKREYVVVDERFLDDGQTEAAGIDKAIAQRDCEHHPDSLLAKLLVYAIGKATSVGQCHDLP